jgi:quinol monooxygenase YgiN
VLVAIGEIQAQIPQREAVQRAMLDAQSAAQQEDGCLGFMFAEVVGEPGRFLVVERWRDEVALQAHYGSASFAAYQRSIGPLLVRDTELEVHRIAETLHPVASEELDLHQDD